MGRDSAASSNPPRPGTWSFERWISDAYHLSRLAARSRATLVRHRLRPRELCRVPPRVPQGGLPPTNLRGGCPATARLAARFNQYDATNPPPTQKHRFAVLHGSSVKARRQSRRINQSHARRLRDRHPVLARLARAAFLRGIERNRQSLFR